ncbi:acyl-CoA dehydrogenase [Anopheles sinensis]|uniref:Acyl-CoA dehydrogenase n=1 Tax=Anopheles sinensis TaxID=74873 RepID=A0A084WUV1_ANOSI|nr:acyl-CoA dehydrogenase [Anopheles sinensis]
MDIAPFLRWWHGDGRASWKPRKSLRKKKGCINLPEPDHLSGVKYPPPKRATRWTREGGRRGIEAYLNIGSLVSPST